MSRLCSVTGCTSIHWGKSYCRMHYARWYKNGDPLKTSRTIGENRLKHPLYLTYKTMHQRCENPNSKKYADYGGRGIKICQSWSGKDGFTNFIADMGDRPTKHTLDRIDNDGNYEPGNCKWSTRTAQSLNQRMNRRNKTGVTGVSYYKAEKRWAAEIAFEGKHLKLGRYDNFADAVKARKDAEIKYHVPILEVV